MIMQSHLELAVFVATSSSHTQNTTLSLTQKPVISG